MTSPSEFPFIGFWEFVAGDEPYGNGTSNDKPHEVYCENCKYRTEIQGIMGAKCGQCAKYLITLIRKNELVKSANIPTQGT